MRLEYRKIFAVYEECGSMRETARRTGLPRTSVQRYINRYKTLDNFDEEFAKIQQETTIYKLTHSSQAYTKIQKHYAYILGLYLGDGHVSNTRDPQTYRLMIYLDKNYQKIIKRCVSSLEVLMPQNKITIVNRDTWVYVSCYSRSWLEIIPQHGEGRKHERDIILEAWQQNIVNEYPLEFVRGLIHSDGSRIEPEINGKVYSRYQFTNVSDDIHGLFCNAVEKLGLSWTRWGNNVIIARRPDVAFLDEHIGPKS